MKGHWRERIAALTAVISAAVFMVAPFSAALGWVGWQAIYTALVILPFFVAYIRPPAAAFCGVLVNILLVFSFFLGSVEDLQIKVSIGDRDVWPDLFDHFFGFLFKPEGVALVLIWPIMVVVGTRLYWQHRQKKIALSSSANVNPGRSN